MEITEIFGKYPSIPNLYMRDPETHKLRMGAYANIEIAYLAEFAWNFTEKIDGTNIRVIFTRDDDVTLFVKEGICYMGDTLTVLGRTDKAQITDPVRQACLAPFERKEAKIKKLFKGPVCFRGECYGPGINKGGKYGPKKRFVLFDIQVPGRYLSRNEMLDIAEQLDIPIVPFVGCGPLSEGVEIVSHGLQSFYGDFYAEGIVAKPIIPLLDKYGERIIVKIKHRDFYRGEDKEDA